MTQPIGQIFLRLLFMLVIPLVVLGAGRRHFGDGRNRSLKRVGLKTLAYTVIVSAIAVAVSLVAVNLLQPGAGVDRAAAAEMLTAIGWPRRRNRQGRRRTADRDRRIHHHHPQQPRRGDGANSSILSVMFFALFFGIGLLLTDTPNSRTLQRGFEGLFDVTMRLILIVIKLAPIAVACFMFNLAALFGWDLLIRLSAYVGVVLLALGIQMFIVYPMMLSTLGQKNPITFFKPIQEASRHGLLDRLVQRDAADRASGRRGESQAAAPRVALRADDRRDRQPERHGDVRGRHRPLPRPVLRHRPDHLAAADGHAGLHPRRDRDRRRPRGSFRWSR